MSFRVWLGHGIEGGMTWLSGLIFLFFDSYKGHPRGLVINIENREVYAILEQGFQRCQLYKSKC